MNIKKVTEKDLQENETLNKLYNPNKKTVRRSNSGGASSSRLTEPRQRKTVRQLEQERQQREAKHAFQEREDQAEREATAYVH